MNHSYIFPRNEQDEACPVRKGKEAVTLYENLKRAGVAAGNLEMIGKEAMELV